MKAVRKEIVSYHLELSETEMQDITACLYNFIHSDDFSKEEYPIKYLANVKTMYSQLNGIVQER